MANKGIVLLFYVTALCTLPGIYGVRPFVLDHKTVKYEYNSDILKSMNAKLFEYKNHNALNVTLALLEDLQQFDVVAWVSSVRPNGKQWTLFNVTLNGCQFLENTSTKTNPVMTAMLNAMKRFAPIIPKKCPFKKNIEYSLVNLYLDEEMFPVYLPEIDFRTFFGVVTHKQIYVFKVFLTGYVAAKNGQKYRNIQKSKQG